MIPSATFIAQTGGNLSSALTLLLHVGLTIGGLVGAGLLIKYLRERMFAPPPGSAGSMSALEELRTLRDTGQITPEEFESARLKLIARVSARMAEEKAQRAEGAKSAQGSSRAQPGLPRFQPGDSRQRP